MESIWASAVAVAGTLLGVLVTHISQRLASRRNERFARSEALRQERISAYIAFATAMEDYRHGQSTRWYRKQQDPDGEAFTAAHDDAHRLRTLARNALYRVKLLTDDRAVIAGAEHAYRCTRDISNARDTAERDTLDAGARQAIEAFVAGAAPLVR
ncbi:hypothetical protein AB0K09_25625 [Streptomyces sp. NPDC049577]|uniref:hypothetical protein n=1 Tax=Streptomyces sp. NPDC049577 TaxID=3155153 RepID=UPI0034403F8C